MRHSVALIALIIFHAVFVMSPVVYSLGFRMSLVVPGTLLVLLVIIALRNRRAPTWVILFVITSLVTSCLSGIFWESWVAAFLPSYFGASLILASVATKQEVRKVVTVGSILLVVLLVGGWFALVLAVQGVPPLDSVSGLHGRVLHFYYTTLTPTLIGNYIRPAGIYDEPGALSFVVSVFACLRHFLSMDRRVTWLLLTLGMVTFSLAHLVYVVIHFLAERRIVLAWLNLILLSSIAAWALSGTAVWEALDVRLVARLAESSDPNEIVAGDNRTTNLVHAMNVVKRSDSRTLLFGVDDACIEGAAVCKYKHPGLSFNALSPLLHYGALVAWPYYLFLAFAIFFGGVRRSWWPLLGVGLLITQRPNLLDAGYSMLTALTFVVALRWSGLSRFLEAALGSQRQMLSASTTTAGKA